jgi:hypothetical protein
MVFRWVVARPDSCPIRDWRPLFPEREPVIGWYDDQQTLVDQEIDLAAGGGIDFFSSNSKSTWCAVRGSIRFSGSGVVPAGS